MESAFALKRVPQSILDAAYELTCEHKIEDISLTELATRAHVSRPTVYQHFGDVASAVSASGIQLINMAMENEHRKHSEDAYTCVLAYIETMIGVFSAHEKFFTHALIGVSSLHIANHIKLSLQDIVLRHPGKLILEAEGVERRVRGSVLAGGIVWQMICWVLTPQERRPSEQRLREMLISIVSHYVA